MKLKTLLCGMVMVLASLVALGENLDIWGLTQNLTPATTVRFFTQAAFGQRAQSVTLAAIRSASAPVSRIITCSPPLLCAGAPSHDLSSDFTLSASVMGASGSSHATGIVPDPGSSAGTSKFLREDAAWSLIVGNNIQDATLNLAGKASNPGIGNAILSTDAGGNVQWATGSSDVAYSVSFGTGSFQVTSSHFSSALPVAQGGLNLTSALDDNVPVGNGTTWQSKALPNCVDTTGQHLNYTTSTNAFTCGTSGSGGAPSGTAGGDLSGAYPNPGVAKINGVALSGLGTGILKNTTGTGTPSIAAAGDFPTLNQSTSGNAATATALAANGPNCSAGSFPLGVDASGASEGCTALPTTLTGTTNQVAVSASTGPITISIPSSPTLPGTTTGTFSGSLTGNASTASALAANGSNCSAGSFPLGVSASGASESCTALPTTIAGTANQIAVSASTGPVTISIPTSPTLPGTTTGTFSGNLTGNMTGNASTATALAANGTNCSVGSYPLGVDASGNAEGCTVAGSSLSGFSPSGGTAKFNASPALDSNLSVPVVSGRYQMDVLLDVSCSDAGGVNVDLGTSAGATYSAGAMLVEIWDSSMASIFVDRSSNGVASGDSHYTIRLTGLLVVNHSGNIGISWAKSATDAGLSSTIEEDSYIVLRKL